MSATAPTEERTLTDAPPARSWAVYTYDASSPPPAVPCRIYGYNPGGSPMTEAEANDLGTRLAADALSHVMVLPNEDAPA